jgi:hypothetical protein
MSPNLMEILPRLCGESSINLIEKWMKVLGVDQTIRSSFKSSYSERNSELNEVVIC